jgi:hypothetical protein
MQTLLTKAAVVGFILAFAAVPLASSANAAAAETTEREMAPRHREVLLKSLTAQWWQWVLSIPVFENPLLDQTGEKCVVGQRGPVWFLAGNFGGGETTRSCSVPEGKRLFFPIVNSVSIDTPDVCGQGSERIPVAELRDLSAAFVDGAVDVSVGVDGKPISDVTRIESNVFEVALPEENLFDEPCTGLGGVPAGIYSPAVDDGIYALLDKIKKGEHELNFHAENPSQNFVLDVTYHLTVVPVRVTPPKEEYSARR